MGRMVDGVMNRMMNRMVMPAMVYRMMDGMVLLR